MPKKVNALIMAASRAGVEDSVAKLQNKSHKCLVEIAGEVMLVRVIQAILDSNMIGRIFISIEDEAPLRTVPQLSQWLDTQVIEVTPSRGNLADSALAAAEAIDDPLPLLITTGDNVLHHGTLMKDFLRQFERSTSDASVAFTEATVVRREAPDVKLAYHRLKDGEFSACNLYGLRTENALRAVKIFESGGQFGKRHIRILNAFGILPFIYYKLRITTLGTLLNRIAKNLGVTADLIMLDYPEGPIDVDNPQFFEIAERMLLARQSSS